jgi:hypothetical protein
MSAIYDLRVKIDKVIADRKLDAAATKGKIALQAGFLLSLISPASPDDPAKLEKLKKAAADILQLTV